MSKRKSPAIKPLGDRVLIESIQDENSLSASGIIIPETVNKERSEKGIVIAVGQGIVGVDGVLRSVQVKPGQTVLFTKYGPDEIKVNGETYLIVSESNILAIIED